MSREIEYKDLIKYGAIIEYDQLQANLDKALKLMPYLEADINRFIEKLSNDLDINFQ